MAEFSLESIDDSEMLASRRTDYAAASSSSAPMGLTTAKPATGYCKRRAPRQPSRRAKRSGIGNKGIHETTPWRH
tara:strand:+ start:79 stop:303 length:225 start_codon:yes stop_codon:yes gene_type:complete